MIADSVAQPVARPVSKPTTGSSSPPPPTAGIGAMVIGSTFIVG